MTKTQFEVECGKRLLDPALVLENESFWKALKSKNDSLVVKLMDEEF